MIVVMLGLQHHERPRRRRGALRIPQQQRPRRRPTARQARKDTPATPQHREEAGRGREAPPADHQADNSDAPSIRTARRALRQCLNEFRSERWIELYKKIEDMIGVLKAKGVPICGLACRRCAVSKATSDTRRPDASSPRKAQRRPASPTWTSGTASSMKPAASCTRPCLRTSDGVFFTRPGAKNLPLCRW